MMPRVLASRLPVRLAVLASRAIVALACTVSCSGDAVDDAAAASGTSATDAGTAGVGTTSGAGHSDTGGPTSTDTLPDDSTAAPTTGSSASPTSGTDANTTGGPATTGDGGDGLCERLGGMEAAGIPALVSRFTATLLADAKINGYFLNSDLDAGALAGCLERQLGALAACPGVFYDCSSMPLAHGGLGISQLDFDDFLVDFGAAYDEHAAMHPDLAPGDKQALAGALADMAGDIVADPKSDKSIYQRIGRKPGIQQLVGAAGLPSTFLDRLATDPAINGFFADPNNDRLRTCLVRQLGGIDGPIRYGLEVTAPDGVEPGVTLGDPCGGMKVAHAGVVNGDMQNAPITIDDFLAVLEHLAAALEFAAVADADRTTILAVLQPLCHAIVADPMTCPVGPPITVTERKDLGLPIDNMVKNGALDDKYDGTLASMLCVTLSVPANGLDIVENAWLTFAMDHTYVGDLTIKIVAPDTTLLTALSRPGPEPKTIPDDGIECCGDDSNLLAVAPVTLRDEAAQAGVSMGKEIDNASVICKDEQPKLDPCDFRPHPGGGPGTDFADFKGKPADGDWKVCFGDSGKGDFGTLQYVGLTLERAKAP